VLIVGYKGELIEQYVRKHYPQLHVDFVFQEERRGIGHAVDLTRKVADTGEPLLIVLGDTIIKTDLKKVVAHKTNVLGVKEVEDPRRFGVAAIVATLHDILITLGFLALLRSEISTGTIAAFLTIVGYSLNDTIIVFDRIREEVAKRIRGEEYVKLLDRAINETLPRTILTSGTTLSSLTALYLFGGAVIRDFAQVLILGIGIGTFSSIFVASPALYFIETRWPPKAKKTGSSAVSSRRTAGV